MEATTCQSLEASKNEVVELQKMAFPLGKSWFEESKHSSLWRVSLINGQTFVKEEVRENEFTHQILKTRNEKSALKQMGKSLLYTGGYHPL